RLALEADVRFDDEFGAGGGEAVGQGLPVREREHHAEVGDGDVVAVDRVAGGDRGGIGREVGDDLVAVEVEIDPFRAAAAFGAADDTAPEGARGGEVVDREGEVEGAQGHGSSSRLS